VVSHSEICTVNFTLDASSEYLVKQFHLGQVLEHKDQVAEEVPVALVYNGVSHAVMLATPQDLEDFALGFTLAEGIISSQSDLYSIEVVPQFNGIELQIEIASACFQRLKEKRRSMTGRTGCGLCGSDSLAQALRMPSASQLSELNHAKRLEIKPEVLSIAFNAIKASQVLQEVTGATHASAFVDVDGKILLLREDVGRHNALDKLVGAIKKQSLDAGFVLTTSRASYEMVQKTASAGIGILVAISAPTGLAIRVAEQLGITLIGFTREHSFVAYCDQHERLKLKD